MCTWVGLRRNFLVWVGEFTNSQDHYVYPPKCILALEDNFYEIKNYPKNHRLPNDKYQNLDFPIIFKYYCPK